MRLHTAKKAAGVDNNTGSWPWLRRIVSSGSEISGNGKKDEAGPSGSTRKRRHHNPLKEVVFTEHALSAEQLADLFPLARIEPTNLLASRGISQEEACLRLIERRRLRQLRRHSLLPGLVPRLLRSLLHQFLHSLRLPLLLSSLFCLALFLFNPTSSSAHSQSTALWLALLQLAALLIFSLVAALQKFHIRRLSNKAFITVQPPADFQYTVIREGRKVPVRECEILDGELLLLKAGQRVPADVRVLHVLDAPLLVDCAWLGIGPAAELVEFTANSAPKHFDVFQARNIVFSGFLCSQGIALGLVIRAGKQTLLSSLSARPLSNAPITTTNGTDGPASLSSSSNANVDSSPSVRVHQLELDYQRLVHRIFCVSLLLSIAAFLGSVLLLGNGPFTLDPFAAFVHVFLVSFIANLPHGLPLACGAQLLLVGRRLKQRCCGGMVLRDVGAADTLGRTSVLMIHSPSVFHVERATLTDLWFADSNQLLAGANLVDWAVRRRSKEKQQKWAIDEGSNAKRQSELAERFGQQTLELLRTAAFCCKAIPPRGKPSPHKLCPNPNGETPQRRRTLTFWQSLRRPSFSGPKRSKVADSSAIGADQPSPANSHQIPKTLLVEHLAHQTQLDQCQSTAIADPVDAALLKFLEQLMPLDSWKSGMELLPREASSKHIASLLDSHTPVTTIARCIANDSSEEEEGMNGVRLMAMGAPEELLRNCTTVRTATMDEVPLSDELLLQFEEQFLRLSAAGKRCVGLAILDYPDIAFYAPPPPPDSAALSSSSSSAVSSEEWTEWAMSGGGGGWCFLGMLVFAEPLRTGCVESVRGLEANGTRVVLLSDEHPALVQALANNVGLIEKPVNGVERRATIVGEKQQQVEQQQQQQEDIDVEKMPSPEKPAIAKKLPSVKSFHQWIPSHIRSPFRRLHKTHSTTSSGYHSTEINVAENRNSGDNHQEGQHGNSSEPMAAKHFAAALLEGWPIDGELLSEMDPKEVNCLLSAEQPARHLLFSRLRADQIAKLVKHFQALGHTVTFVGQNGLADGLALKESDFGIAPADSTIPGSLLAQQTAIALCSDMDLQKLVRAIHLCRMIRQNLASALAFSLSHTPALMLPIALTLIFGFSPGLNPIQILTVALFTAIPPSIALVFSRPSLSERPCINKTIDARPPLSKESCLGLFLRSYLLAGIPIAIGCLLAYLYVYWHAGIDAGKLTSRNVDDPFTWEHRSNPVLGASANKNSSTFDPTSSTAYEENQQIITLSGEASSAWQLTLVASQFFHVWLCAVRTRWHQQEVFNNFAILFAIVFDLCLLLGLNIILLSLQPPPIHIWLFPLTIGCLLFILYQLQNLFLFNKWRMKEVTASLP